MPHAPSAIRGFLALIRLTFRRQWRVQAMGWSTILLMGAMTAVVFLITTGRSGWGFETRWSGRFQTQYRNYPETLDRVQMLPIPSPALSIETAIFGSFRAHLSDDRFLTDYALTNYSRWVIVAIDLGFLLPLINLAFASQAIGGERESRTMIWLLTRPIPRSAIYLAKLLGVLPWCVLISLAGLAALGIAGGPVGRAAALDSAPAVALGSIAFSCLFHLLGSIVKRPAVMGLAYIFFFETLVANLPGSLKQLSLNYYVKSMLFDVINRRVATLTPEALDLYAPADATTSVMTLVIASVLLTIGGAVWFGRVEPTEEM